MISSTLRGTLRDGRVPLFSLALAVALLATASTSCDLDGYCIDCNPPDVIDASGDGDGASNDGNDGDGGSDGDSGPCMVTGDEVCDGLDNDCDGTTDEGDLDGEGDTCSNNVGECVEGVTDCQGGAIVCAGGVLPVVELCDDLDNDCDGVIDNGNPEGGAVCGSDIGECVSGVTQCVNTQVVCQGNIDSTDEVCDGRDNDCDGLFDEGVPDGGACGPAQGDVGECMQGVMQCVGGVMQCVGANYPSLEQCDGDPDIVDHDCDGDPLNGYNLMIDAQNCGTCGNVCAAANAIAQCSMGACTIGACQPDYFDNNGMYSDGCEFFCDTYVGSQEACNGADDDCDGITDEELVTPEVCDTMMNCQDVCDLPGECTGTASLCAAGAWTCPWTGVVETDGMGNLVIQEALCDGLDNDCDGLVDEAYPQKGEVCFDDGLGICQRQGMFECNAAQDGLECANLSPVVNPQPETCNGLDDDCNNVVDDGFETGSLHDWVDIGNNVEIFAYEASRPDADAMSAGVLTTHACSKTGALPWTNVTHPQAEAACASVGGRLCTEDEWQRACKVAPSVTMQDPGADGLVVIEAEDYTAVVPQGAHTWTFNASYFGFSGPGAMWSLPDQGSNFNTTYVTDSPRMDFDVDFAFTGTHYIWIHGYSNDTGDNSMHAGIDGTAPNTSDRIGNFNPSDTWLWRNQDMDGGSANFNVPTTGVHTVNIWMREDGFIVDKIVLTTNPAFVPTGLGPDTGCGWSHASNCETYQPDVCNGEDHDPIAGPPDDDLVSATGAMAMCYSDWGAAGGVYDLSGNVKEWTAERAPDVNPLRGGAYDTPGLGMACDFDFTVGDDTFLFPNVGFRCCR